MAHIITTLTLVDGNIPDADPDAVYVHVRNLPYMTPCSHYIKWKMFMTDVDVSKTPVMNIFRDLNLGADSLVEYRGCVTVLDSRMRPRSYMRDLTVNDNYSYPSPLHCHTTRQLISIFLRADQQLCMSECARQNADPRAEKHERGGAVIDHHLSVSPSAQTAQHCSVIEVLALVNPRYEAHAEGVCYATECKPDTLYLTDPQAQFWRQACYSRELAAVKAMHDKWKTVWDRGLVDNLVLNCQLGTQSL